MTKFFYLPGRRRTMPKLQAMLLAASFGPYMGFFVIVLSQRISRSFNSGMKVFRRVGAQEVRIIQLNQ